MSDQQNQNENEKLTAFEADLAALRPRVDGLDHGWRELLAKEALLTAEGGRQDVMLKHNLRGCVNPAGHHYVCIHCGSESPTAGWLHHGAWPSVATAMTSAAAVLLMIVLAGPVRLANENGSPPKALSVELAKPAALELGQTLGEDMSYVTLRERVLADGLKSWRLPASGEGAMQATEAPLPYQEQVRRLLLQQGYGGS